MKHSRTVNRRSAAQLRDRIRQAREALGLSRSELARKVGVVVSAAVQWEQPKGTVPSIANLIAIAQVTDISFEWLVTGRGHSRVGYGQDDPVFHRDSIAMTPYEERMLAIARKVPGTHRDHLLSLLEAIYLSGH